MEGALPVPHRADPVLHVHARRQLLPLLRVRRERRRLRLPPARRGARLPRVGRGARAPHRVPAALRADVDPRPAGRRRALAPRRGHAAREGALHADPSGRGGDRGPDLPEGTRLRPARGRSVRARVRDRGLGRAVPRADRRRGRRRGPRQGRPQRPQRSGRAARPVPRPDRVPDHGRARGCDRVRWPHPARRRPRRLRTAEVPQLARDAAVPEVARPLRRAPGPPGHRRPRAGARLRGLHRRHRASSGGVRERRRDLRDRRRRRAPARTRAVRARGGAARPPSARGRRPARSRPAARRRCT
ncbi:MAG: hypothetical protein RLZZ353_1338 [Actinomycetota bacterium]